LKLTSRLEVGKIGGQVFCPLNRGGKTSGSGWNAEADHSSFLAVKRRLFFEN
jgi:hypothetical protein